MLNCQTKLHAPFFPTYPSKLPDMLASSLIPPNDSHSSWLKWWNYGNISKNLDNSSSPKKNSPDSPFLKGRLLIPGPQVCKICAEIYQKTTTKRYKFDIFGRSRYNNLPVFSPMLWCPLFRIFPPPHHFNLDFLTQIPRWRDWSQVEKFQLLEFCGAGFVAQTCWKRWAEWRLVILMLRLVTLCVHNRRVTPYVNFLVFIRKRGPFLKKTSEVRKKQWVNIPRPGWKYMVYNWLYIHLLFAHHVAILPRPWKMVIGRRLFFWQGLF